MNHKNEDVTTDKKTENEPADVEEKQENVLDFVNEIKAQAEKVAWSQAGFIYEPTSGLYYDTKSTYYYSPDHDLYYNGNDANWYRLNPRTDEFIFHSGTEASQAVKKVKLVLFLLQLPLISPKFQVQWQHSLDSLLTDFQSLRIKNLRTHALGA